MIRTFSPGMGGKPRVSTVYGAMGQLSQTHRQAVEQKWATYENLINHGTYVPNKFPLNSLPFFIPLVFLLLPKKLNGPRLRLAVVAAVTILAIYNIVYTRAKDASFAALVGIVNAYLILWALAHLGIVDPKNDYSRIKRTERPASSANGNAAKKGAAALSMNENSTFNRRRAGSRNGEIHMPVDDKDLSIYKWQGFPSSLYERFDWVMDIFSNPEGQGWNWGIATLPPPPRHIQHALAQNKEDLMFKTDVVEKRWHQQARRIQTMSEATLFKLTVRRVVLGYIALDVLKTLVSVDPFFYGQIAAPPPVYLPAALKTPFAVKGMRLLIAQGCVHQAVQTLLLLKPLYFLYHFTPQSMGTRGEAWMFPHPWGSFQSILDQGVLGFWSTYWHQSFRYIFTAPSNLLMRQFKISPRSVQAQFIRLYVAFFCSGILHAGISHTAIGDTYPIRGPMFFFLLQPVGITLQLGAAHFIHKSPIGSYIPRWLDRITNLLWCIVVGYLTGPLLVDDLARGGQFLFEPVPFSVLRGLGFGNPDDGFYCWYGRFFKWHWDGWKSGMIS